MKYLLLLLLMCCHKPKVEPLPLYQPSPLPLYQELAVIDNGKYNAFGITVSLKDGSSAIIYREGSTHVGDIGSIKMRNSKDWNTAMPVYSDSMDDRNVAGGVTPGGRVIIFFTRYKDKCKDMGYIYSDDGILWSKYKTISAGTNTAYSFYGGLVSLDNNTLLQSWYGVTGKIYSSCIIKSTDNGLTWGNPVTVLSSSTTQYTETSFLSLGSGSIIGLARGENTPFYTQVLSSDNGVTWASKVITTDTVSNIKSPPFLFNNNGVPMCIYANRMVNKVRLMSYKNGEWTDRKDLCSLDAGGYPSINKYGIGWFWNQTSLTNAQIVLFSLNL